MFFYLSKILVFFIKPFNLVWICIAASFLVKGSIRRYMRTAALIIFIVFSPGIFLNEMLLIWEVPAVSMNQLDGTYRVAIVLGGTADTDRPPFDRLYFTRGAERITQAVELYNKGVVDKILFTGGRSGLLDDPVKDNAPIVNFYVSCGVDPADILIENRARNTYENAVLAREVLDQMDLLHARHLLLTSAFHMRRAHACFIKQGINCVPFSTDFHASRPEDRFAMSQFVPSAGVMGDWEFMLKEFIGYIAYRVVGYL